MTRFRLYYICILSSSSCVMLTVECKTYTIHPYHSCKDGLVSFFICEWQWFGMDGAVDDVV